jgi:hypothetical protein
VHDRETAQPPLKLAQNGHPALAPLLIVPDPGGRRDGHPPAGRSRTRRQLVHLRARVDARASREWNTYVAATIAERETRGLSANTARFR